MEKERIVTIKGDGDDPITLDSVFQVPGMKKILSSVANVVDAGNYVLLCEVSSKYFKLEGGHHSHL